MKNTGQPLSRFTHVVCCLGAMCALSCRAPQAGPDTESDDAAGYCPTLAPEGEGWTQDRGTWTVVPQPDELIAYGGDLEGAAVAAAEGSTVSLLNYTTRSTLDLSTCTWSNQALSEPLLIVPFEYGVHWAQSDTWFAIVSIGTSYDGQAVLQLIDRATGKVESIPFPDDYNVKYSNVYWTGTAFLIWGGSTEGTKGTAEDEAEVRFDGRIFDPETRTWTPIPAAREPHSYKVDRSKRRIERYWRSTWTGQGLLVFGSMPGVDSHFGYLYSPSTKQWRALNMDAPLPLLRRHFLSGTESGAYLSGGEPKDDPEPSIGAASHDLWFYSFEQGTWEQVQTFDGYWGGTANCIDGACVVRSTCSRTFLFDEGTRSWKVALPMPGGNRGLYPFWSGHHVAVLAIFGDGMSKDLLIYTPEGQEPPPCKSENQGMGGTVIH